jgi:hypothetical protein
MARRGDAGMARVAPLLGWIAVIGLVVVVAIIVGRPGRDAGTAAATGSPAPSLMPVIFGTAIDHDSGEATDLTSHFRPGEPFAYSVRLPAIVGQDTVYVEVRRLTPEGQEQVQAPQAQKTLADRSVIAYLVTTDGLIEAFGTGDFVLRIFLDPAAPPIAAGSFTVVPAATTAPS